MNDDRQDPEAQLARVADGSLPPDRAEELRAKTEASPELAEALAEQELAVTTLRSLDVPAPPSLRDSVAAQLSAAERRRRRSRPRFRLAVPALAAAVAVTAAAIIVLAGGGGGAPTIQETIPLTLAAARLPAPVERTGSTLDATAAGIPFPYWQRSIGWRAVGARSDRVAGRRVLTVFYRGPGGRRVGYAIVSGAPLAASGGRTVSLGGVPFRLLTFGSIRVVTWVRSGHTCVIAGRGLEAPTLLRLATT